MRFAMKLATFKNGYRLFSDGDKNNELRGSIRLPVAGLAVQFISRSDSSEATIEEIILCRGCFRCDRCAKSSNRDTTVTGNRNLLLK